MMIKEIPDIPDEIKEAALKGRLVVFIGAGVSRIIGCPSWEELAIKRLKAFYETYGLINYQEYKHLSKLNPRKILSICENIKKDNNMPMHNDLSDILKANPNNANELPIYEDLIKWQAIYVTTNYDNCFEDAAILQTSIATTGKLEDSGKPIETKAESSLNLYFSKDQILTSNLQQNSVIYLHGNIRDENSLILTTADYLANYQPSTNVTVLLADIFKDHVVLFIGYGLEEYEILEYLVGKGTATPGEIKHFMLYPFFNQELKLLKHLKRYYASLGITLIEYAKDEKGYKQLVYVVREWTKEICSVSKPKSFYDNAKLIDEVINDEP